MQKAISTIRGETQLGRGQSDAAPDPQPAIPLPGPPDASPDTTREILERRGSVLDQRVSGPGRLNVPSSHGQETYIGLREEPGLPARPDRAARPQAATASLAFLLYELTPRPQAPLQRCLGDDRPRQPLAGLRTCTMPLPSRPSSSARGSHRSE